ncbi:MAG: hypothetical protein MUC78_04500 [Bacteroidales bacterium]|jgi:hypothetical protein|nr:hypothetical protein [Bacteroidales bacterium]
MKVIYALMIGAILNSGTLTGTTALFNCKEIISSIYFTPLSISTDSIRVVPFQIMPFQLEIVPPSSGVQFFRNGIIFLSHSKNAEKMLPKHLSFGIAGVYFTQVRDSVPDEFRPFASELLFSFPVDAATFSSDYNTVYFTRIPDGGEKEKIFRAAYSGDKWIAESEPESFCTGNNLFTHPALSKDGSFMIFSSDMSGTHGGLDLFISRKDEEKWGEPENIGDQINSQGNELYASLDNENNLYFSSDGLPGEGGYDIYVSRYDGNGWSRPQSIAQVINSKHDEVAFKLNLLDGETAFYTSRERSGRVKAQLLKVTLVNKPVESVTLSDQFIASAGFEDETEASKPEVQTVVASISSVNEVPKKQAIEPVKEINPMAENIHERPTEIKNEAIIHTSEDKLDENDLIYRVQIQANVKPVGSYSITLAGKTYKTYEYLYMGGYRTTVGEFSTLSDASKFQNVCRQNGYNQAFIAAFSNNVRITDSEARNLESKTKINVTNEEKEIKKTGNEPSVAKVQDTVAQDALKEEDEVIYRVQILANTKPVGSYPVSIGGKDYKTYEYLFMGGYRTTVGAFKSLSEASKFQNYCRDNGFEQSFVVAFKNGVRSTDPALFK